MTREEAFGLIKDFDGEYPTESIPPTLEYLEMSQVELEHIIDTHRRKDLWEKNDERWVLKHLLSESEI
jgi:hypothetical protein